MEQLGHFLNSDSQNSLFKTISLYFLFSPFPLVCYTVLCRTFPQVRFFPCRFLSNYLTPPARLLCLLFLFTFLLAFTYDR